jgi:acyl carrier protein
MTQAVDWLMAYFSKKNDLSEYDNEVLPQLNYFDEGLIDSFGIIELVMNIEKDFKVKFPNDAFQDRRFSTLQGLAEIIEEQKSK